MESTTTNTTAKDLATVLTALLAEFCSFGNSFQDVHWLRSRITCSRTNLQSKTSSPRRYVLAHYLHSLRV